MKRLTISALLSVALLAGCSSSDDIVPDTPPAELYSEAQQSLKTGDWTNAIKKLEALDSRYPFGAYSEQVQLDLIFAYYKSDDLALGLASISRFNRLNPTHEKSDWVLYMRGLTYMAQDRSFMHDLFNIDRSDRDPEPARSAFKDFKKLLERYPNSLYANDARKRMASLKNRLANYELATADFYIRREAWISAINRSQELQRTYPNTNAARKSLELMLVAYEELELDDAILRTEAMIAANPAD
ncbi:outer membrane protein assembly factor BamD [Aliivibrio kagoshimensis]|uniref:outer membrane protein assembly factor BamD n=1 Tax=Aliivibrio kagoshimensis TaxID=2910230 RepID=UPI003D09D415